MKVKIKLSLETNTNKDAKMQTYLLPFKILFLSQAVSLAVAYIINNSRILRLARA